MYVVSMLRCVSAMRRFFSRVSMVFGIAIAVPRHLQIMSVTLGFHL